MLLEYKWITFNFYRTTVNNYIKKQFFEGKEPSRDNSYPQIINFIGEKVIAKQLEELYTQIFKKN